MGKKRRWSIVEEEILRYRKLNNMEIGKLIDRTPTSVSKKKSRMGLAITKERWTAEEIKRLERLWNSKGYPHKVMGRSKTAIKKKGIEMNLGTRYNADGYYLTTGDVGDILGKHPGVIRKHVLDGEIEAELFGKRKIARISPESMMRYFYDRREEMRTERIDWVTLMMYVNTTDCFSESQKEEIYEIRYRL